MVIRSLFKLQSPRKLVSELLLRRRKNNVLSLAEARDLIESSATSDMKDDVVATAEAKRTELQLLESLDEARKILRQKIAEARRAHLPHAQRNWRRKYAKTLRLREKIASRLAPQDEDWSSMGTSPDGLFPSEWANHSEKAKSLIRKVVKEELRKRCLPEKFFMPSLTTSCSGIE
ncbi:hypothetical protein ACP70R_047259 [Stipagrostis hirtigluma subsp. patula]